MRVRGQRGRWPVRSTYPPGGGWGCKSWSLGPFFSDGRLGVESPPHSAPSRRLFSRNIGHSCDGDGADGEGWTDKNRQDPTPAAGRIGLPIWPPSGLAPASHLASEGTRAIGRSGFQGLNGLAKPDQREKCRALVLIDTRKHRSARPRAFRHAPERPRTGDAAEAKVTSCEIKGFTEQEVTFDSAVAPAPDPAVATSPAPARSPGHVGRAWVFGVRLARRRG